MKKFFALLILIAATSGDLNAGGPRVIDIKVKKFEYSPEEIHLKKGEPVVLNFTTLDRKHGFKLPEFGLEAVIKPGEVTTVKFTPDKTGKFSFHCSVFCGSGHESMTGMVYVE